LNFVTIGCNQNNSFIVKNIQFLHNYVTRFGHYGHHQANSSQEYAKDSIVYWCVNYRK